MINCICESLDLSVPAQEFSDRNHDRKPSISYYSYYVNLVGKTFQRCVSRRVRRYSGFQSRQFLPPEEIDEDKNLIG